MTNFTLSGDIGVIKKGDTLKLIYAEDIKVEALSNETVNGEVLVKPPGLSTCLYIPVMDFILVKENDDE